MSEEQARKDRVDGYVSTIERMEPELHMTDPGAYGTSAAISLKRIADALEKVSVVKTPARMAPLPSPDLETLLRRSQDQFRTATPIEPTAWWKVILGGIGWALFVSLFIVLNGIFIGTPEKNILANAFMTICMLPLGYWLAWMIFGRR